MVLVRLMVSFDKHTRLHRYQYFIGIDEMAYALTKANSKVRQASDKLYAFHAKSIRCSSLYQAAWK